MIYKYQSCFSLASILIPDSVTMLGNNPFVECDRIKITCDSPYFRVIDDLLISNEGTLIACLTDKVHITIPDSVTTIGNRAFEYCRSLTSILLPDSVTKIGKSAFHGCQSLTSIHIPESVTTIGNRAFEDCRSFTSIHLPDSVTTIGDRAFYECNSLTTIHLPDSLTTIGNNAFWDCSLITIYIPKGTKEKFEELLQDTWLINKIVEE